MFDCWLCGVELYFESINDLNCCLLFHSHGRSQSVFKKHVPFGYGVAAGNPCAGNALPCGATQGGRERASFDDPLPVSVLPLGFWPSPLAV